MSPGIPNVKTIAKSGTKFSKKLDIVSSFYLLFVIKLFLIVMTDLISKGFTFIKKKPGEKFPRACIIKSKYCYYSVSFKTGSSRFLINSS
jgi:hypothetical protein